VKKIDVVDDHADVGTIVVTVQTSCVGTCNWKAALCRRWQKSRPSGRWRTGGDAEGRGISSLDTNMAIAARRAIHYSACTSLGPWISLTGAFAPSVTHMALLRLV